MKVASDNQSQSRRSKLSLAVLLLAIMGLAMSAGFSLPYPIPAEQPIADLSEVAWLKGSSFAVCFAILAMPFFAEHIPPGRAKWIFACVMALVAFMLLWLGPLLLAPQYGWSHDDCMSFSVMFFMIPVFIDTIRQVRLFLSDSK